MAAARRAPGVCGVSSNTSVTSFEGGDCGVLVRKTPLQLQTLENLYADDKYPAQGAMEDYALALGLTYKQVRSWFIERRRKEKNGGARGGRMNNGNTGRRKRKKKKAVEDCSDTESEQDEYAVSKRPILMQDMLLPADYILTKVFRKDGPPLGVEFDSLPSSALQRRGASSGSDSESYRAGSDVEQRVHNMDKVTGPSVLDGRQPRLGASLNRHGKGKGFVTNWRTLSCQNDSQATKRKKVLPSGGHTSERRHGAGKGLMTLWRTLHPASKGYPTDFSFPNRGADVSKALVSRQQRPSSRNKRPQKRKPAAVWRKLEEKFQEKNSAKRRRKVNRGKNEAEKKSHRVECRLALGTVTTEDQVSHAMLVDDEELELRELQAGSNPLTCGAHFSTGARSGCPLCKGLLAKFPPDSVRMKQPFCNAPWSSSLELGKKIFKVFRFVYTYALILDTCPFTMDEFIQAFHDKDSYLLGELHVCLLKFILSDIEKDLYGDVLTHTSKNCMFLSLLHSVQSRKSIISSWNKSLNPLTWTEILRQVLLAAGYGSADGAPRKGSLKKDVNPVTKYGLCPGTLKAELFCILLEQGNQGVKLSDLTESPRILGLNHADTKDELEDLISSILAGDITLFEKISSSTYRLRLKNLANDDDYDHSDSDDSGSIDYSPKGCANDVDCDSRNADSSKPENSSKVNFEIHRRSPGAEIDESHSGEAWMLGLMEGEYSDLSVEEKLNIMAALVDLLCGGSTIRQEDPRTATSEFVPRIYQHGSGAKIKRASATQHSLFPARDVAAQNEGLSSLTKSQPIDSACVFRGKDMSCRKDLHPMQSICLGSDRRYNRYWLFLGPCHAGDPGHRRVYFESSEDGHYEIIDTEEALCALVGALDSRGRREAALLASLKKRGSIICEEMSAGEAAVLSDGLPTQSGISGLDRIISESSSPVSDVDNHSCLNKMLQCSVASSSGLISTSRKNLGEEKMKWRRLQAYDLWIWKSFYSSLHSVKHRKCSYLDTLTRCETCHDLYWRDEKHCRFCHMTFELDFDLEEKYAIHAATCQHKEDSDLAPKHKVLPSQLQALKAAVHAIELAMPKNSLIGAWTKSAHKLWVNRLIRRTSSLEELLQALANFVGAINEDWLSRCNATADVDASDDIIASFKNIPRTSSAVALWLVKLDALIASQMEGNQSVCR